MGIDASIILQGKAPQINDPQEMQQRAMSMKQMAMQNQNLEQTQNDDRSMRDIMKRNVVTGPDGKSRIDNGAALSEMYKANPQKAMEFQKQIDAMDFDTLKKHTDASYNLAWQMTPENYSQVRAQGIQMGLPNWDKMPEQYSEQGVQRVQMATLGGKEQVAAKEKQREFDIRTQENRQRREETLGMFGERKEERLAAKDEKRNDRDLSLNVPGFERTGEVLPKPEEASKFRKATAVSDQLKTKLERLKALVKDKGSFEYGGNEGTEMESLATEIQLISKSPELYELGVLTGPDMSLLQKITADPASMNSLFTQDSSRIKQIDSQLSSIDGKLSATAKSMGYKQAGQKASADFVTMRAPDGSLKQVKSSDVAAATKAGGKMVDTKVAGGR